MEHRSYADWHTGQAIVGSLYGPYVFLAQISVLLWYPAIAASKLIGIGFGLAALLMLFRNYPLPFFRAQILRNYPQF